MTKDGLVEACERFGMGYVHHDKNINEIGQDHVYKGFMYSFS